MVTAIMLMNVERGRINAVAEDLADRRGVSEVYSVSGSYDLVATLRVTTNEELAALVTEELAGVDGIEHTETLLAFRAHSRHDLEAMLAAVTERNRVIHTVEDEFDPLWGLEGLLRDARIALDLVTSISDTEQAATWPRNSSSRSMEESVSGVNPVRWAITSRGCGS